MDKQDKPLRDRTLGEAQHECITHDDCDECPFNGDICNSGNGTIPSSWNLTENPRFTEDEVAAMRVLYAAGVRFIAKDSETMQWLTEKPEWNENVGMHRVPCGISHMLGYLPDDLFPSIRPGMAVELAQIVEGKH